MRRRKTDNITKCNVDIAETDDKTLKQFKISWYTSVLIMVAASALQHFLYDWTGCPFIGLWAPVGESLAEHDKLMFYPALTWWVIMFFAFRKKMPINAVNWFTCACVAAVTALSLMTSFYCIFFLGLTWPQKLPLHIMFEILSFILTQLLGWHLYKRMKPDYRVLIATTTVALTIIILMAVFTFYPPNSPIFEIVSD